MSKVTLIRGTVVGGKRYALKGGEEKTIECTDAEARYLINTKRATAMDKKRSKPSQPSAESQKSSNDVAGKSLV
ncbi:MAG: hypothetical protein COB61_004295 [Thiotrichales bacterium]|nr:hypothetical protein [Thiotrichales bacterium]